MPKSQQADLRLGDRTVPADIEVHGEVQVEGAHVVQDRYDDADEAKLVLELRNQAAASADVKVDALFKSADGHALSHAWYYLSDIPAGGRAVESERFVLDSAIARVDLVVTASLNELG